MTAEASTLERSMNDGFEGLAAEMMSRMAAFVPAEELDFYETRIRDNGGPALDIACGMGRHVIPLVQRGLDVVGVDASEDAIRLARARAEGCPVPPTFYRQTMEALELPRRFATLYIPNGSFHVLAERRVAAQALERFRRQLSPGGQLLLELSPLVQGLDAYVRRLDPQAPWVWRAGASDDASGEVVSRTWVERVSRFEQHLVEKREYQLIMNGRVVRTEHHALNLHFYSKHEAELMLEAAGFEDVRWYANHRDAAPSDDSFGSLVCGARNPD